MESHLRQPGFARDQCETRRVNGGRVGVRSLPPLHNHVQPPSQLRQPGFGRAASHAPLPHAREGGKDHSLPPLPRPAVSAPITVWREKPLPPAVLVDPASVTDGVVDARHRSRSQRSLTRRLEPLDALPQTGAARTRGLEDALRKRSLGRQLEPLDAPARGVGAALDARHGHVPCPPGVHTDSRQTSRRRSNSRKRIPAIEAAPEEHTSNKGQCLSRKHSRDLHAGTDSQSCIDSNRDRPQAGGAATAHVDSQLVHAAPDFSTGNTISDVTCKQSLNGASAKCRDGIAVASTADSEAHPEHSAMEGIGRHLARDDSKNCSITPTVDRDKLESGGDAMQDIVEDASVVLSPLTCSDQKNRMLCVGPVDADVQSTNVLPVLASQGCGGMGIVDHTAQECLATQATEAEHKLTLSSETECAAEIETPMPAISVDTAGQPLDASTAFCPTTTLGSPHAERLLPRTLTDSARNAATTDVPRASDSSAVAQPDAIQPIVMLSHDAGLIASTSPADAVVSAYISTATSVEEHAPKDQDKHAHMEESVACTIPCAGLAEVLDDEEAFYIEHREALIDAIRNGGKLQRRGEGGVGLLNQGATCYMNSLLQALFHTPEFRLVLYRFKYDASAHGEASRCIPLQLQRLFAGLQLSLSSAISTKALTVACGFTAREAREQHDVQELCRVLFDALERSASALAAEIAELYAGRVTHYVRSRDEVEGRICQSRREEKFLDLQVPIQGCKTLEDALQKLVEPEVLDGENRWLCDELGEKVDALKGMEFNALPKIFCLQLLRFVFDLATMRRVKLNDAIAIPLELDLGLLLMGPSSETRYELAAACLHRGTAHGGHYHALVREAHSCKWLDANDSNVRTLGPEEMKHLFSTQGASTVCESNLRKVEADDGGSPVALVSADAYFLIYRAVGLKAPEVEDVDVPEGHRCELAHDNACLADLQRAHDFHRSLVQVTVFAPSAVEVSLRRHVSRQLGNLVEGEASVAESAGEPPSVMVTIPGSKSVLHLVNKARSAFIKQAIDDTAAAWAWAENLDTHDVIGARLRQYDHMHGEVGEPLDPHALVRDVVGRVSAFSQTSLLLEVCPAGMKFEVWEEGYVQTVVCRWNESIGRPSLAPGDVLAIRLPAGPISMERPADMRSEESSNPCKPARSAKSPSPLVGSLREAVMSRWELHGQLALVPLSGTRAGEALLDDSQTLAQCGVTTHDVLCAELVVSGSIQSVSLYEQVRNTVHLTYNHPDGPEDTDSFKISISKAATLLELKSRIADALGLSHQELHLRRAQRTPQLKDETKTLRQVGLADSDAVFVGHGAPCAADECMLQVALYTNEKGSHKTQEVFQYAARGGASVRSLREALLPRLLDWAKEPSVSDGGSAPFKLEGLTWKRLRLRDGQSGKQFAILRDERTLRSALHGFSDGRLVAVQVLNVDEELTPDDLIFAVRPWRVREDRLHAPTEFVFNRARTIRELLESLTERFRGLMQSGFADGSADTGDPMDQDRLEVMALPTTGMPITIKRLASMKWAECELNKNDPDVLAKPLSDLREIRDGVTLVVRSSLAAATGAASTLSPKAKAKVMPKAGARKPFIPAPGVVRKERNLVIEVVCPERLPEEERGLVIDVACPEGAVQLGSEANSVEKFTDEN